MGEGPELPHESPRVQIWTRGERQKTRRIQGGKQHGLELLEGPPKGKIWGFAACQSDLSITWSSRSLLRLTLGGISRSLCSSETGNRDAEWTAGNVVMVQRMEESDRAWLSSVLSTHACFEAGDDHTAIFGGPLDQLAGSFLVEDLERIVLEDAVGEVGGKELAHIIPGVPERHLSQVVGTEGEELGSSRSNLVCDEASPRDLNHGAHLERDPLASLLEHLLRRFPDEVVLVDVLGDGAHKRDHDLGVWVLASRLHVQGSLDDGPSLHSGDFRRGDTQAASAESEHGVILPHVLNDRLQLLHAHAYSRRDSGIGVGRKELVERRVQETDGDGESGHGIQDAIEGGPLEWKEVRKGALLGLVVLREDHAANFRKVVEEHVLRAAETNALGTLLPGFHGIFWRIRVGQDIKVPHVVYPLHEGAKVAFKARVDHRQGARQKLSGVAIE
mmetsp:Transcript_8935/g.13331  ORF Transcript_8935/g.13331 Transcript_8935/m.13331 type:complete len:445 (+) Transcript_8935:150-1484(+)